MAEITAQHNPITASLAIALATEGECWRMALGLLADVAESTGQHNAFTASWRLRLQEG